MTSVSKIKTNGIFGINISCMLLIMCLYICWVGSYQFDNEFMLGLLLIILGMLYISALYMIITKHGIVGASIMLTTILLIISIAVTSKFQQKGGAQGGSFICLGLSPMLSGLCFALFATATMSLFII